jgi:hypothetical protein
MILVRLLELEMGYGLGWKLGYVVCGILKVKVWFVK